MVGFAMEEEDKVEALHALHDVVEALFNKADALGFVAAIAVVNRDDDDPGVCAGYGMCCGEHTIAILKAGVEAVEMAQTAIENTGMEIVTKQRRDN